MADYPHFVCGIRNVGNTCFINVALQCIARMRKFSEYFRNKDFEKISGWESKPEHLKQMCREWEDLSDAIRTPRSAYVIPNRFYNNFRKAAALEKMDWMMSGQNDSHEFMMFLLDILHRAVSIDISESTKELLGKDCSKVVTSTENIKEELNMMSLCNWATHYSKEFHPLLTDLFNGQLLTIISSVSTDEKSFRFEPFSSINIAVPQNESIDFTIQECLDEHFATEKMVGDSRWESPTKGKVDAVRASKMWKCPDTLILSIKRFKMTGEKIRTLIKYPLTGLDMSSYCIKSLNSSQSNIYDLTGIVIHTGILYGGHYIGILRNPGGNWVYASDEIVRSVDVKSVTDQRDAYTLIYQRHDSLVEDDLADKLWNNAYVKSQMEMAEKRVKADGSNPDDTPAAASAAASSSASSVSSS